MGFLGWIWVSLGFAATYGAIMVSLLLYRSGSRLLKAGKESNLIFLELRNLPEQELEKTLANTSDQLTGLLKSRRKTMRTRSNEKLALRRARVARLNTLISEQVRRKK